MNTLVLKPSQMIVFGFEILKGTFFICLIVFGSEILKGTFFFLISMTQNYLRNFRTFFF